MTKQMMVLIGIALYIFFTALFIEPNSLKVVKYEIKEPRLDGVRVVFLSDMHLGRNDFKRLDKIIKVTNDQQPDIVLMGGDFLKGNTLKSGMDVNLLAQKLSMLECKKIYTVLGNHDWWAGGKEIRIALEKKRIKVLENETAMPRVRVRNKLVDIVGVEDLQTRKPDVKKALKGSKVPRILITHNPDIYHDVLEKVSLILAGHTHGGQFVLPFTQPMFVPSKYGASFAGGLIDFGRNPMIISRGIGTTVVPARFGCPPEVVVVDFRQYVQEKPKRTK